jgi:hypothetical protein
MPSAETVKTTPAKAAAPRKNARDDARKGATEQQAAWSFRLPRRVKVASGPDTLGRSAKKTMIAIGAAVMAWCFGYTLAYFVDQQEIAKARAMVASVVERIVQVESGGDPNAKNPRSTATGAAQFIDATWLELIRKHRADLAARPEPELLELRRDPKLAREVTTYLVERNAKVLKRSGQPITAGTLYLSHFAGGAGAVAILSAKEHEDAATTLALADSTGKMSRDKLVKANPFLDGVTAGGLKRWADRKMTGETRKVKKQGTRTAQATRSL